MIPYVDLDLFIVALVAFCALFGLALAVRPEMRDGKKLSRVASYTIGAGVLIASILALETWRGAACECWTVTVPQLWLDVAVLSAACAGATVLHRLVFGEPRRGNPHRELRQIEREAEDLTNAATGK